MATLSPEMVGPRSGTWLGENPGQALCIQLNARCDMREPAKRRRAMDRIGMGLPLGILALTLSPLSYLGAQAAANPQTTVPTTGRAQAQPGTEVATSSTPSTSASAAPGGRGRQRAQSLQRVSSTPGVPRVSNQAEQPASAEARVWAAQLEAMQREQDERLLQRQQADSQRQQQEQERAVEQWVKTVQAQQDEPRIQDAPGPAQTGLLPGVPPPPSQPSNEDEQRIQDAPGPAQTIPAPQPQPEPEPEPAAQ
jgi:hypothetical protein